MANNEALLKIKRSLQEYYTHDLAQNQDALIKNVSSISEGWETDIYTFDVLSVTDGVEKKGEYILRIYPGAGGAIESAREFKGMRCLHESGYPVPQVHLQAGEDSPFGYPFVIMDRIDGQVMRQIMNNAPVEEKEGLLTLFCDLFVNLHNLDWRPYYETLNQINPGDPYQYVDYWLFTGRQRIKHFELQGFSEPLDWFEEKRSEIPCNRPSVVHLDFHPNNVLLRADGQAFVIDWSQVSISDARFDLAWTLVLAFAYMGEQWRDQILAGYESLTGTKIDRIEVFEAFACTRRLFTVVASISHGAETFGMRPDAVASMRQQMGALSNVYNRLQTFTGIKIPEVERLLG